MKNRILLSALALTVCLAACNKAGNDSPSAVGSVSAVAEPSEYRVVWADGASFVQLYGQEGGPLSFASFDIVSGAGTPNAGFECDSPGEDPIVSLYPASFLNVERLRGATADSIPVIWPAVQKYAASAVASCPMYSFDSGRDGKMRFHSIGGVLKVKASGSGKVKSIRLTSSSPIAGKAIFDVANAAVTLLSTDNSILLDCGSGVELDGSGTEFGIPLPCCTLSGARLDFVLDFSGMDAVVSKTVDGDIAVSAGSCVQYDTELSLDGALIGADAPVVQSMAEVASSISGFVSERLGVLFNVDPSFSTLIGFQVSSILNKHLVGRDYTHQVLRYVTKDPSGNYVAASGLVCWPENVDSDKLYDRIVSVQHGTCDIDFAPSLLPFCAELAPVFQADSRNVVVLADYLGYGVSRTPKLEHPYMHAGLTGSTCADMLRAAETFLTCRTEFRYAPTAAPAKPVSLCGYSQGGQATMAALYTLQDRGYTDRIDDVRVGAGPVDLLEMWRKFSTFESYCFMGYVPYVVRGMVYGESLELDLRNVYAPEVFASGMDREFDTTMLTTWHSKLGLDVHKVLHPDFFTENLNADLKKIHDALRRNSIINCGAPVNPSVITLYHETEDEEVPYDCAVNASREWGCRLENLTIVNDVHFLGALEFFFRFVGEDVWANAKTDIEPLIAMLPKIG